MKRPAGPFPLMVALGAIILARVAGAQAQDARAEGPIEIDKCQTISHPGSYKLVGNLTATTGDCLVITADAVTIDLAGFSITSRTPSSGTGIVTPSPQQGIAVRNGSIFNLLNGVDLSGGSHIVEGLRIVGGFDRIGTRIKADGIVKGNIVEGGGTGITAIGIVTGNSSSVSDLGMSIGRGSTVIGNIATSNRIGIRVVCPSVVTGNVALGGLGGDPFLEGNGCTNENNVERP